MAMSEGRAARPAREQWGQWVTVGVGSGLEPWQRVMWFSPAGVIGLGGGAQAVATAVPARAQEHVEEHQIDHQGHCQQHDFQLQAHPQEDGASDEGQNTAAGVVLGRRDVWVTPRDTSWSSAHKGRPPVALGDSVKSQRVFSVTCVLACLTSLNNEQAVESQTSYSSVVFTGILLPSMESIKCRCHVDVTEARVVGCTRLNGRPSLSFAMNLPFPKCMSAPSYSPAQAPAVAPYHP